MCACTVAPVPTAPSALATAHMPAADGFEPAFYRAFLQNGFESPDRLEPVRILPGPFRLYLKTVADDGRAIDQVTLDTTEQVLLHIAGTWSGETYGVIAIERGRSSRERVPGWITVKWTSSFAAGTCGRSTVGVDGGFIELDASGACSCGMATRVYPRLVRHELGHAMGYYHTDDAADVMYGRTVSAEACDLLPSDRERRHARFAYSGLR